MLLRQLRLPNSAGASCTMARRPFAGQCLRLPPRLCSSFFCTSVRSPSGAGRTSPWVPLNSFEEALYFSAVSFTTVGYGDVVLSAQWRILGVSEAVVGILLFGWSVGLLLILINDAMKQMMERRQGAT